mgnify:CR=1 FL=1|jgi:regulatory protein
MSQALRYALKLLSYRARSAHELRERLLRKGFDPRECTRALEELERLGYLDDVAFSQYLLRHCMERKLLGLQGALRYMQQMGLSRELAEAALSGYDEWVPLRRLLRKRRRAWHTVEPPVRLRRLRQTLQRRGFSAQAIRRALKEAEQ